MTVGMVFVVSFLAALSGALMPGPLLTVTIAQTARKGFLASILLVAGHSLLELALVIGLAFGLGQILVLGAVKGTVTALGGAMLLWMGYGMVRDARRGVLDLQTTVGDAGGSDGNGVLRNPVVTGMVVSISNPYWVIWWATIGLTFFAALSQHALAAIIAFYIGHIMGDIVWYIAVGAAVSTGRRLISPGIYRFVVQICGAFLVFLGGSFLYMLISGKLWEIEMTLDWLSRVN